jgi:hypothetical protein
MTESYLTQSEKLELAAIMGGGNEYEQDEQDEQDEYTGEYVPPARIALTAAEYARQRCAFDASDAIRNGLHAAHVAASRKSQPVGWAW